MTALPPRSRLSPPLAPIIHPSIPRSRPKANKNLPGASSTAQHSQLNSTALSAPQHKHHTRIAHQNDRTATAEPPITTPSTFIHPSIPRSRLKANKKLPGAHPQLNSNAFSAPQQVTIHVSHIKMTALPPRSRFPPPLAPIIYRSIPRSRLKANKSSRERTHSSTAKHSQLHSKSPSTYRTSK
jgi:hypothetical protein